MTTALGTSDRAAVTEDGATPAKDMRTFTWIWSGQTLSLFGSGLSGFALAVWIFEETGSVTKLAMLYFCSGAPAILIAPLAGSWIDRWDRRRVMLWSDTGAGLGILAIALLLVFGRLDFWLMCLLIAVADGLDSIQPLAFSASTTLLVPKKHLNRANAMVDFGRSLANLFAPMVAGVLVVWLGLHGVLMIDVATFLLAVSILLTQRIPNPPREARDGTAEAAGSLWRDARFGFSYISRHRGLIWLLGLSAGLSFTVGVVQILITPMVLSLSSPAVLGMVLTVAGLGMAAGGGVMAVWGGPRRKVPWMLGFIGLQGVILVLCGLFPGVVTLAVCAFLFMFGMPVFSSCSLTLWQLHVPAALQGRVFAIRQMAGSTFVVLAYLISGPMADYVFEPLAAGPLRPFVETVIGEGPRRGIALFFLVLGVGLASVALSARRIASLRNVDNGSEEES